MGRNRKPTALKVLNGSADKHPSRVNKFEPNPAYCNATPPDYVVGAREKEVYRDIAKKVLATRVMTVDDQHALAQLAKYWTMWEKLSEEATTDVMVYDSGYQSIDPRINAMIKVGEKVTKLLVEFGLTPAARSRIVAAPPSEEDPVEEFLKNAK